MRTPATTHQRVPGASTVVGRGQRLRQIIAQALSRRRVLDFKSVSRMPEHLLGPSRLRLEKWMEVNPTPSHATVRAFPLVADVYVVMPHTAEGKQLMYELRGLMTAP